MNDKLFLTIGTLIPIIIMIVVFVLVTMAIK